MTCKVEDLRNGDVLMNKRSGRFWPILWRSHLTVCIKPGLVTASNHDRYEAFRFQIVDSKVLDGQIVKGEG